MLLKVGQKEYRIIWIFVCPTYRTFMLSARKEITALQKENQSKLQEEFAKNGYVKLPDLLNEEAFLLLKEEVNYLEQFLTKFDFLTKERASQRRMNTLDDIPYGFILFFDAPLAEDGGLIKFIPEWHEFCKLHKASLDGKVDELVEQAGKLNLIQVKHDVVGDAYLLQADKCLHRVTGLNRDGVRRAIFNIGFDAIPNRLYDETESVMYSEP